MRIWSEMLARSVFQKRVTIVERRLHSHDGKFVEAELYSNTRRRETSEGLTTRRMLQNALLVVPRIELLEPLWNKFE